MPVYLHNLVSAFLNKLIQQSVSNPEYQYHKKAIAQKIKEIVGLPWEIVSEHDDVEIQCRDPKIIKLFVRDYDLFEISKQLPKCLSPDQYYEVNIVFGKNNYAVMAIDLMVE